MCVSLGIFGAKTAKGREGHEGDHIVPMVPLILVSLFDHFVAPSVVKRDCFTAPIEHPVSRVTPPLGRTAHT